MNPSTLVPTNTDAFMGRLSVVGNLKGSTAAWHVACYLMDHERRHPCRPHTHCRSIRRKRARKAPPRLQSPPRAPPGARDFAGALDRASAKHSRKDDSAKSGAGKRSGGKLPPSGGIAPPAATPRCDSANLAANYWARAAPRSFSGLTRAMTRRTKQRPRPSARPRREPRRQARLLRPCTSAGATVAVISGAALSNVSAGADNSGTASEAGSPRRIGSGRPVRGLQSAAPGAGGPVVDPTASGRRDR